jgi:uncharacterized protein (DUF1697 family)
MTTYIAFLRAINVSGQKLIKMEELRTALGELAGVKNVRTYIQSGNVIFEGKEGEGEKLRVKIEKQIKKVFGYEVEAFVRTTEELNAILKNNPFHKAKLSKDLALYVTFLEDRPNTEAKKIFESLSNDVDSYKIEGKEVYALVVKDGAKSLFSNMLVEKKLKQKATGRNQTTLHKILELVNN